MNAMRICEFLWVVFLVVWFVRALKTKPVQTRERVSSRLSYTVLTIAGAYTMFGGESPRAWLHIDIFPASLWIQVLAVPDYCRGDRVCDLGKGLPRRQLERRGDGQGWTSTGPNRTLSLGAAPYLFRNDPWFVRHRDGTTRAGRVSSGRLFYIGFKSRAKSKSRPWSARSARNITNIAELRELFFPGCTSSSACRRIIQECRARFLLEIALALNQLFQIVEKCRIGNLNAVGVRNNCFSFGSQRTHGEGHGNAMIVEGFDLRAMQFLPAGNSPAIFRLLDLRSHGPKIVRDRAEPVALLHAQLRCVANFQTARGVGSDGRQDREFVDQQRGLRALDASPGRPFPG